MNCEEKIDVPQEDNQGYLNQPSKSKSLFTIASETYLHTFLEQKSKGLYDIIKDEDRLGNQLSPHKIKKEDLDLFLQRNKDLLDRKKALANQQIEDSETCSSKIKPNNNTAIADNFYKSQMKRDEGKQLMIKEMANNRAKELMSECTFQPQIPESSKKIIQTKSGIAEREKRVNNVYIEVSKRSDVFNRLYNYDLKVQARNLILTPSNNKQAKMSSNNKLSKTKSKSRPELMTKYSSYNKLGLKSQISKDNLKRLKASASKDNMSLSDHKFFRTNSIISRFSPSPVNRVKVETAKSAASTCLIHPKNIHSDLLLIQKLINEYESFANEEICTENEYFSVLQKMGFIKENDAKSPKSNSTATLNENELLAMQSFQIIFNSTMNSRSLSTIMKKNEDEASERSQYTITLYESIFSFLLCVSGYHVSSSTQIENRSEFSGPQSTFDLKAFLTNLKSKKLKFTFNQFYLDGLCDIIRKKFSLFSKNRNDYINLKTKQKNEVKIIGIRQEIESHISSPQRSITKASGSKGTFKKPNEVSGRNQNNPRYQLQKGDAKSIQSRKKNS